MKWILRFSETDFGKIMLGAIIGGLVASMSVIFKDIYIDKVNEKNARDMEYLERRLSDIYVPLYLHIVTTNNRIWIAFKDPNLKNRFVENYYLLSPELKKLFLEYLKQENGDISDGKIPVRMVDEIFNWDEKIRKQLKMETEALMDKHIGVFGSPR